jgi:RND family efflux transporter MFP subunit
MAPVDVTPDAARLAGILTVPVERGTVARSVRTVGAVVADETRVRHVHSRTAGWVERLHVNFTGQIVRAGEPMLSLYSQELLATQEEYLRARESAARFASSRLAEVRRGGEDLLSAARRRLELFDVPAAFIEELDRSGTARRAVPLLAPVSGHVTVKGVSEGQQVEPGTELFVITDLSRVWIEADFYEYEAPTLALGQAATITLPYDPSTVLAGRIAYVYPTLHAETRAVRVRFEVPNPETALKPGMFADVELAAGRASGLVVPDSAVMDTGTRQVVFVASGPGRYVPREVRTGIRSAGVAEVTAGLAEGEQVVVKANFLLDSESRLRAALTAASSGTSRTPAAVPDHGRH